MAGSAGGRELTLNSPIQSAVQTGNRFALAGFKGVGYDRGRPLAVQVLWLAVSRSFLFRWWFPNRARVAVLRAFGARVGRGTLVRHDVKVHWPWKLSIGEDSWVGEGVWVLNLEDVEIGSNTCISQGVLLCTGSHDRHNPTFEFDNGPITIGDRVWIATRSIVLRGTIIGNGVTVAANCVVARDVPEDATVYPPRSILRSQT